MYVKGVGPARAVVLETKGLRTVGDLLAYAPFRYEDRSNVKAISTLAPGEMATVLARIHTATTLRMGRFDTSTGAFTTFATATGIAGNGTGFVAIPAPATLALAGLGMCASRRRR